MWFPETFPARVLVEYASILIDISTVVIVVAAGVLLVDALLDK